MPTILYDTSTPEDNRFHTRSGFKECLIRGGEIEFSWKDLRYGTFGLSDSCYIIARADGSQELRCDTPDGILDYMVGSDLLRDVITQVTVLDRTI